MSAIDQDSECRRRAERWKPDRTLDRVVGGESDYSGFGARLLEFDIIESVFAAILVDEEDAIRIVSRLLFRVGLFEQPAPTAERVEGERKIDWFRTGIDDEIEERLLRKPLDRTDGEARRVAVIGQEGLAGLCGTRDAGATTKSGQSGGQSIGQSVGRACDCLGSRLFFGTAAEQQWTDQQEAGRQQSPGRF